MTSNNANNAAHADVRASWPGPNNLSLAAQPATAASVTWTKKFVHIGPEPHTVRYGYHSRSVTEASGKIYGTVTGGRRASGTAGFTLPGGFNTAVEHEAGAPGDAPFNIAPATFTVDETIDQARLVDTLSISATASVSSSVKVLNPGQAGGTAIMESGDNNIVISSLTLNAVVINRPPAPEV